MEFAQGLADAVADQKEDDYSKFKALGTLKKLAGFLNRGNDDAKKEVRLIAQIGRFIGRHKILIHCAHVHPI